MFKPELYSILIVSLEPGFIKKISRKLTLKGYNVYYFDSEKKYFDFIKYENVKIDFYVLDIRYFEFHHLLSEYEMEGVTFDIDISLGFNSLIKSKLNIDNYPVHSKELGLKYCSNNIKTYQNFISAFNNKYSNFENDFNSAINNNDINYARKLIHGLRGISLNLGSRPLFKYCSYIDEYFKEQIDKKKKLKISKVQKEINKVFSILSELEKLY